MISLGEVGAEELLLPYRGVLSYHAGAVTHIKSGSCVGLQIEVGFQPSHSSTAVTYIEMTSWQDFSRPTEVDGCHGYRCVTNPSFYRSENHPPVKIWSSSHLDILILKTKQSGHGMAQTGFEYCRRVTGKGIRVTPVCRIQDALVA